MKTNVNILFIVVDALRARNLGCYGYSKPISPNIDSVAKEGVLFEEAYSCIVNTDPSFTTIFSGMYPLSHEIIHHGSLVTESELKDFYESGIKFLPEILRSLGYTTLGIDWLDRWHKRGYDYYSGVLEKRGGSPWRTRVRTKIKKKIIQLIGRVWTILFKEAFILLPSYVLDKILESKIFRFTRRHWKEVSRIRIKPTFGCDNAFAVTDEALRLIQKVIENDEEPFFLFIHYWDTHWPYNPSKEYLMGYEEKKETDSKSRDAKDHIRFRDHARARSGSSVEELWARYDGSVFFVDTQIGRLTKYLKEHHLFDKTLIVFTSDHGESLTEHGIYFTHHGLYDGTIHIPLILRGARLPKNRRIKGFVQHFDLVPTIIDILGVDMKKLDFDGKSVVPLMFNRVKRLHPAVYAEEVRYERKRCIRTSRYKYIYALSKEDAVCKQCGVIHGGVEELYDLKDDPQELENIVDKEPKIAKKFKIQLSGWVGQLEHKKRAKKIEMRAIKRAIARSKKTM